MPPTYSETNSKQLLDHLPTIGPPKSTPGICWKNAPEAAGVSLPSRNHGPGLTASVCEPVSSEGGGVILYGLPLKKSGEVVALFPYLSGCFFILWFEDIRVGRTDIHAQKSLEFLHLHKKNYPIPGMCSDFFMVAPLLQHFCQWSFIAS